MKKNAQKKDLLKNLKLYYGAIGIIILGYIFLLIGSANSFTSITLGPIIIVLGYIVAVPFALLSGVLSKDRPENPEEPEKS